MGHHHHSHGHEHHHTHSCDHDSADASIHRAFAIGIALNMVFIAVEIAYGLKANSLALLADAGHNASDVAGLIMAWGAAHMARSRITSNYTYGLRSTSILAALANAILLLVVVGGIGWEAIGRMLQPAPIATTEVMVVAAIGILINGATAMMFHHRQHDLNLRGAYIHMLADAAVSFGVIISAVLIYFTGWHWLDALTSLLIAVIIIRGTWGLLRESTRLALHGVPAHIDSSLVQDFLKNSNGVSEVHDLHIWAMSTSETALSAHLVMPDGHPGDTFLHQLSQKLEKEFRIHHATIQIEIGNSDEPCTLVHAHK